MNKLLKKKMIIIPITLAFLILILYVSYAYYNAEVQGNESISTVAVNGGFINIDYVNNSGTITAANIIPGWETTKSFTVSSSTNFTDPSLLNNTWYDVLLVVDQNDFVTGSLEYMLTIAEEDKNKEGIYKNSEYYSIPTGTNLDGIVLGSGYLPNVNVSHTYNLTLRYIDSDDIDQKTDMYVKFYARVNVRGSNIATITFDLDGGTLNNFSINEQSKSRIAKNTKVYIPVPVKEDYAFVGWEVVEGNANSNYDVVLTSQSDIKLKALWIKPNSYEFDYTGGEQQFIAEYSGYYKIELWGASGANYNSYLGGNGAYVAGQLFLEKSKKIYIYTGEEGIAAGVSRNYGSYGFNGGSGGNYTCYGIVNEKMYNSYGGGATDIRLVSGEWNNFDSLKARIMVAAGGASANENANGAPGGGVLGIDGGSGKGATQISSGEPNKGGFGYAGIPSYNGSACYYSVEAGAGSGYYGGGASNQTGESIGLYSAGSGSSFVSGHSGCNAISEESTSDNIIHTNQSEHYSGYVFTDTVIKAGNEEMPTYDGTGGTMTGNDGPGHARITYLHN